VWSESAGLANLYNMKVLITKGTAPLGLGYAAGSEADLNEAQAAELIECGYAKEIEQIKHAVVEQPEEIKKAVTKRAK